MGKLYDTKTAIAKVIEERKLDTYRTLGAIGLKSGMLLGAIKPDTPDDAAKLSKLQSAAKEILGVTV